VLFFFSAGNIVLLEGKERERKHTHEIRLIKSKSNKAEKMEMD
jgi:hypothetical protein